MRPVKSVAIVGAGIGGLTTGNALLRLGLNVRVFDRAPFFSPTAGAGFSLSPNGQVCLNAIGFTNAKDLGACYKRWIIAGKDARLICETEDLKKLEESSGYSMCGVLRARLVEQLEAPLKAAGLLHFQHDLTDLQQDANGVKLRFSNGKEFDADVVVGADGINSKVASLIGLGGERDLPVHSGENIFYGVIDNREAIRTSHPYFGAKNTLLSVLDRGEYVSFPCRNASGGDSYVWGITYRGKPPAPHTAEWTKARMLEDLKPIMNRQTASHPIHEAVALTSPDRILHFGLFYRQHKKQWHVGRVTLLGDACHATLPYVGQGANMAIEDAVVFAQCLDDAAYQYAPALERFYQRRSDRTKKVVDSAGVLGSIMHVETPWKEYLRDMMLRFLLRSGAFVKMGQREIIDNCPLKPGETLVARNAKAAAT